jgi:hypothetical protein
MTELLQRSESMPGSFKVALFCFYHSPLKLRIYLNFFGPAEKDIDLWGRVFNPSNWTCCYNCNDACCLEFIFRGSEGYHCTCKQAFRIFPRNRFAHSCRGESDPGRDAQRRKGEASDVDLIGC